ncbi:MAG: hypothetical protein J6B02_03250, partial [Selenomonadales bacterium]|nr:hypothetical protein [Selenomonadales bacterium]
MKKRWIAIGIGAVVMTTSGAVWASPDAGAQLNQDRTFFERQQIERQMEQEMNRQRGAVVESGAQDSAQPSQTEVTFVLNDIAF